MRLGIALVWSAIALGAAAYGADAPAEPYKVLKTVPVGGAGRWDYVTADSEARRLYIPRSDRVTVYDLDTLAPVGEIPGTGGVHGTAIAPESGHGFTSNGRGPSVTMFDTKTLKTLQTITVSGGPDGILYDPGSQQVFVFSHRAPNATVIKASDGSVVGTVDLGGAPEGAVSDGKGHIYVDIEDTNEVATIDPATLKVTARWGLKGAEGPAGLGIDQEHGRLFVGCHSQQMVILDTDGGAVLATLPIGSGVDATVFDPGTHEAFAPTGDGKLTVIREIDPTHFEVEQTVPTATGARTCALDTKLHQVITVTAVPQPGQPATQPSTGPGGRGRLNGTFTILVVGKQS